MILFLGKDCNCKDCKLATMACFYLGMLGINLVPIAFYHDLSRIRSLSDHIRITSRLFRLYGVEPY